MTKKDLKPERIVTELTEQSVFFRDRKHPYKKSPAGKKKVSKSPKPRSSDVPDLRTSGVRKLQSSEVTELRTYRLRNFDQLRRLDLRLTGEQKRFLDDLEEDIRQGMPEGERGNPTYRRITKNSVVRVLVEIVRQLDLKVDASSFRNEGDLLKAIYDALSEKLPKLRSSEVRK